MLPPFAALVAAGATRNVLPSLAAGGLVGAWLLAFDAHGSWGLLVGPIGFVSDGLLGQASQPGNAQVLVLIALIAGFVRLLEQSGAARALVASLAGWVTTSRRAEVAAWVGGLVLFFSDLGNILILGPVFRPVFDRLGLARERLAWIVDSTAAPVSVLVPFVTYGVYIIGLIDTAFPGDSGLRLFRAAVPYQLYPLLSVVFVGAMAVVGRHRGPMARAVASPPDTVDDVPLLPAWTGWGPLGVLFATLIVVGGGLWWSEGALKGPTVRLSLATGYLAAIGALVWSVRHRMPQPWSAVGEGMGQSTRLMVLLVLAWTLGHVCKALGTGDVVAGLLGPWLPAVAVPVCVFAAGAAVSFATGTSWGTFAILMPIAASLATATGLPPELLIGAVLSGGVFGDHCSPISDTTLLASASCGVEHDDHVRTQLPYAAAVGALAAAGFVAAGGGAGVGALVAAAVTAVAAVAAAGQLGRAA